MDRILNPRIEKQSIYEIYRACRLCGAGAGYKMPIIQTVVDLDVAEVELKQKIRECVQVEVNQDDKMPPLICELCVDKVNDFYEFLDMCRQTNLRTRMRLGLPIQNLSSKSSTDSGDCILGMTEPVYINDDSDGEPLAKHKSTRTGKKKEPEVRIKVEPLARYRDTRSSGGRSKGQRAVSPLRVTRNSRSGGHMEIVTKNRFQGHGKAKAPPKSILKKEKDVNLKREKDTQLNSSRLKRTREKETKPEVPVKKVKIAIKSSSTPSSRMSRRMSPKPSQGSSTRQGPRSRQPPPTSASILCPICNQVNKTGQGASNHMRSHVVTYTNHKLACNACGLWFRTSDEAATHHRRHRNKSMPYHCKKCSQNFKPQSAFDEHFTNDQCIPSEEVPDIKCSVCWRYYATNKLYEEHKCGGEDSRPGGKCNKCNRSYALLKNLKKHESACTAKKKGDVDPALLAKLKLLQVRVRRCDPLLGNLKGGHVDVSTVHHEYGLDKNCVYPYITTLGSFRVKSEFSINQRDGMVNIEEGVKEEFCSEEFIHWDSDAESDSDSEISRVAKPVESLSILTLKTIFSLKLLGKVPRKRRRVKTEKFDMNTDLYVDISQSIDNIIDNLGEDDDDGDDKDLGTSKGDLSIDFDDFISGDKKMEDNQSKGNNSFDDLLKNGDEVNGNQNDGASTSKTNDNIDREETVGVEASKNDAPAVSFDDLLKNDYQDSKTNDNQDDEIVKSDVKDTEVNITSRNDTGGGSSGDSHKNDDNNLCKTNDNQDNDEKVSNENKMSEINTELNDNCRMDTDDAPNNDSTVASSNRDDTEINDDEKSKGTEAIRNVSNEQSIVIGVNDKVLQDSISIDNREDKLSENEKADEIEHEEAKDTLTETVDVSKMENNTSVKNTDNKAPIKDLNSPSINISKETVQNYDNGAIEDLKTTQVQPKDSKCTNIVNGDEARSDEFNLDDVSDTEMDDKKLMEALDAQIGETNVAQANEETKNKTQTDESTDKNHFNSNHVDTNSTKHIEHAQSNLKDRIDGVDLKTEESTPDNDRDKQMNDRNVKIDTDNAEINNTAVNERKELKSYDKITLDELISIKQNPDLKSLDLDSISDDDFNFDV